MSSFDFLWYFCCGIYWLVKTFMALCVIWFVCMSYVFYKKIVQVGRGKGSGRAVLGSYLPMLGAKKEDSMARNMENTSNAEAEKNGWKIIVPFPGELVGKAVYSEGAVQIMKSTKRFKVEGGWLYNTSTEIHKKEQVSVAEALVFVPVDTGSAK